MGGPQLHLGLRGRRHARRSDSISGPASARRWRARSSAGTATASRPMPRGEAIPLADARSCTSATTWRRSAASSRPSSALEAARERRDRTYDPALADLFVEHGRGLVRTGSASSSRGTPSWRSSPSRTGCSTGEALDQALTVAADFIDLKSPYMGGHSRRCAELAADAARVLGLADDGDRAAAPRGARPRLRHHRRAQLDLGQGRRRSTRTEFDRVELHPMLTEQMLRRSPALAVLNPVAAAHHEKCDGSGYHTRAHEPTPSDWRRACWRRRRSTWADDRTRRPSAVLGRGRRRRAAPPRGGGRARAAGDPRGARGRRPRRAGRRGRAGGRTTRAGCRGARSTCCASPRAA